MKSFLRLVVALAFAASAFGVNPVRLANETRVVTTPNSDDWVYIDGLIGGTGKLSAPLLVLTNQTYSNPGFITSLAASKLTGVTFTQGTGITITGTWPTLTISSSGGGGSGDMLKSTYDANNDGIVDVAASANAVSYANVTGKPSFATVSTSGLFADLLSKPTTLSGYGITDAAAATHTHSASDIVSGILPVARGGTGTSTPGIVAGTNVTVSGTWPNQTVNASGGGSGITAMTGDVTASGTGSVAATLATSGVTAGSYGSSTLIPVITFDAKGRATSASTVTAAGGGGSPAQALVTVAPSSTSRSVTSDYTATGTTDETQINSAITLLTHAVTSESVTTNGHVLIDAGDATTNWTASGGSAALDTTVKQLGTGSIKLTASGSAIRPSLTVTASSVAATSYDYLDFFAFMPDAGKLLVTITTSDGSRLLETKPETVGAWSHVLLPLREAFSSTGTLGSVTSIKFQALIGESSSFPPTSFIFWIDNVGFSTRAALANKLIHPGSISIASRTLGTDYDLNYDTGILTPIPGGGITSGSSVSVNYTWGSGVVKLLGGTYNIGTTGILLKPYTTLDLTDGVKLVQQTTTWAYGNAIIQSANTANQLRRVRVLGGEIVGYRDGLAQNVNVDGVQISNCYDVKVSGLSVVNMSGAGIVFPRVSSTFQDFVTISGCNLERCGSEWVDVPGGTYATLAPSYAQHRAGMELQYSRHFDITGNTISNGLGDSTKVGFSSNGRLSDNRIRNTRMGGWFCIQSNNITGTGNVVERAGSRGVSLDGSNFVTFTGNTVTNSGRENVWISNSNNCLVADNILNGAGFHISSGGATGDMANYCVRISAPDETSAGISQIANNNKIVNNIINCDSNYCQAAVRVAADSGGTLTGNEIWGNTLTGTQTAVSNAQTSTILYPQIADRFNITFDGSGSVIASGARTVFRAPYAFTITGWKLASPQTGSITVDIRKGTSPSSTTTVTASATPLLSSANTAASSTLTGWTTSFAEDDIVDLVVTGTPATIQNATLTIKTLH